MRNARKSQLSKFTSLDKPYRSRESFLDLLKLLAKRAKRHTVRTGPNGFRKATPSECLDDEAKDLGFRDWQHLVRVPHPQRCEGEIFLSPELVAEYATPSPFHAPGVEGLKCAVAACEKAVDFQVFVFDYYDINEPARNAIFLQPDFTCPYLCLEHAQENENTATGIRRPRSCMQYRYSNHQGKVGTGESNSEEWGGPKQGYTCYLALSPGRRFSVFSHSERDSSIRRRADFAEYVQQSLDSLDFDWKSADEEVQRDILRTIARTHGPLTEDEYAPDGRPYEVEHEVDDRHLDIVWNDAPEFYRRDAGEYDIILGGKWSYVVQDDWEDPPRFSFSGSCWHHFIGKPRGKEMMSIEFFESNVET